MSSVTPYRRLQHVYPPPGLHWVGDGFRVLGFLQAYPALEAGMNPFLLLDYHPPYEYPPSKSRRGVGTHPHRGFETITLAFEGAVAHHDSAGGGGEIGPGDVQWMSAASGVLHQEYHAASFAARGGAFHMAQLWLNLPARHKMGPPTYHAILDEEIPRVPLASGLGYVRVVAGEYQGTQGPGRPFTPVAIYDIQLQAGAYCPVSLPASFNVGLLAMEGAARVNETTALPTHHFAHFEPSPGDILIQTETPARLLLLAGEPIDEPVVSYGPFVMNTMAEIEAAVTDFSSGKFGSL